MARVRRVNYQSVTDPRHQVPATFDADSGIVEVFPADPNWEGAMVGIRPDVGSGAFVRMKQEERWALIRMLAGNDAPVDIFEKGENAL